MNVRFSKTCRRLAASANQRRTGAGNSSIDIDVDRRGCFIHICKAAWLFDDSGWSRAARRTATRDIYVVRLSMMNSLVDSRAGPIANASDRALDSERIRTSRTRQPMDNGAGLADRTTTCSP
jgi:hypothetical protein